MAVDPLRFDSRFANPDGTPTREFLQQWQALRQRLAYLETQIGEGGGGGCDDCEPPDLDPSPAGTYGDDTTVPVITVDSKGRVTGVSPTGIAFPGGGGGGGWTTVAAATIGSSVPQIDVTDLNYDELYIAFFNVTAVSGQRAVRLSTSNGASFFDSSGDYVNVSTAGIGSNASSLALHDTAVAAARSGDVYLANLSKSGLLKPVWRPTRGLGGYCNITGVVDAVRLCSVGTDGNLTGGTYLILGR